MPAARAAAVPEVAQAVAARAREVAAPGAEGAPAPASVGCRTESGRRANRCPGPWGEEGSRPGVVRVATPAWEPRPIAVGPKEGARTRTAPKARGGPASHGCRVEVGTRALPSPAAKRPAAHSASLPARGFGTASRYRSRAAHRLPDRRPCGRRSPAERRDARRCRCPSSNIPTCARRRSSKRPFPGREPHPSLHRREQRTDPRRSSPVRQGAPSCARRGAAQAGTNCRRTRATSCWPGGGRSTNTPHPSWNLFWMSVASKTSHSQTW